MTHRMYGELADEWTLISPVEEYVEEAGLFRRVLIEHARIPVRSVLELGSGGGNNAWHLKSHFDLTLVDPSEDMLRQSRRVNPELPHHVGDMRDVRLGLVFDAVFVHDAISYMTSRADLLRAMTTAFVHCRAGGVALFVPDETTERFEPATTCGGTDRDGRGVRYLEWGHDPDPDDETCVADYVLVVRERDGSTRVVHDQHVHGLFPHQVWLESLAAAGFEPRSGIFTHSDLQDGYELFVGVKPT